MAGGSHDGSITFSTALDNAQLEKELAGLTKKIEKKEREIADLTAKRDQAKEKSLFDSAALDSEKAKLQEIKDRLAEIRARSKDKSLSLEAREDAKALIPSVQEELDDQKARVRGLQSEWDKTENAVDRYAARLADAEAVLARQKEEAGTIQQQIAEAEQAQAEARRSAQVADQRIIDLNQELLDLKRRQKELEQTGIGLGYEEYDKNAARIAGITQELKEYQKALTQVNLPEQAGQSDKQEEELQGIADSAKVANQHIADLNRELEELRARQKELKGAKVGLGYEEYDKNAVRIAAITLELKEYQRTLADAGKGGGEKNIKSTLANLAAQLSKPIGIATTFGSIISGIVKKMVNAGPAAAKFGTAAVKAFSRATAGIAKLLKKVNILPKLFGSIRSSMERLGSIAKSALIFSVIYKGLSLVRTQMGAYLGVNAEFTTALRQLKGVLLTAFQPIYDVVVPAVTTLMNVLSRAIAVVSQFMAVLFGTTAKKAQSNAKDLYEQANALKATGAAADEAAGSLAGFDEINTIQTEPTGGGGGGAAVETGPLFDWEYEETPFESWGEAFSALLDKMLSAIPTLEAAFGGFASWLNDFTKKLYDMFTFPGVLEKVQQLGRDLANAFNSLVDWINWYQLGQALGAGLNLALQFLVGFLYTFDWLNLGRSLAECINGAVSEIDWYAVGQLLWTGWKIAIETLAGLLLGLDMPQLAQAASQTVIGFFNSMQETIAGIDWSQIGFQIATFLNNIDWAGVITAFVEAARELVLAFLGAMGGFIANADPGVLIAAAGLLAAVVVKRIVEMVVAPLAKQLVDNVIQKIAAAMTSSGFASILGTVGQTIAGIGSIIGGVALAASSFFSMWNEGFSWAKEAVMLFGIALTAVGAVILGAPALVAGVIAGIVSAVATMAIVIHEHWEEIKQWFLDLWAGIQEVAGTIAEWFSANVIEPVKQFFTELWQNLRQMASDAWIGIQGIWAVAPEWFNTAVVQPAAGFFSGLWDGIKQTATSAWEAIQGVWSGAAGWFSQHVTEPLASAFEAVGGAVKGTVNGLLSNVEGMLNAIIKGVNWLISQMNKISFDVPDWVPAIGGNSFGLNIPSISSVSIPRLAQGAVIPANREFMAVLGDQSHGNNLEAPEELIRKIVREESGGGGETAALLQAILEAIKAGHIIMVDRRVLGQTVTQEQNRMTRQSGRSVVLG